MRYLEDLVVGDVVELGRVVVDRDEVLEFGRRFDPQLFHLGDEGPFGGVIASGWHTGAMFSRLCVDSFLNDYLNLGGQGFDEVRFHAPVRPGDELRATLEVIEARASERKPDRGTLGVRGTMHRGDGELVFSMTMRVRIATRAGAQPR